MKTIFTLLFLTVSIGLFVSCNEKTNNKNDTINIDTTKQKIKDKSIRNVINTNSNKKSPELFKIEGTYTFRDSLAKCFLKLEIFKISEIYTYKLNTPTRNLNGEVTLKLGEKNDGYYITFNNITWSENLGALDDEGEQIDENVKIPNGLEGYLYENKIVIQNFGNSMNYYIQLSECDTKYIELEKVKTN